MRHEHISYWTRKILALLRLVTSIVKVTVHLRPNERVHYEQLLEGTARLERPIDDQTFCLVEVLKAIFESQEDQCLALLIRRIRKE